MSVLTRMFGFDQAAATSLDVGAFDAVSTQPDRQGTDNPMQTAIEPFAKTRAAGMLKLDMVIDKACVMYPDMPVHKMANFSGCDVSGMIITQSGIDRLREMSGDQDLCLNLRDANIDYCIFTPASTWAGCLTDQCSIGRSTEAQHVTFDGLSDKPADISLQKGNWTGFAIKGTGEATPANHVSLTVAEGAMACAGDISNSRLTSLHSTNADLSGLNASCAKAMAINVVGGRLNGADFSGASIAPGGRINADLIGANFEGATLGDCCLAGSRLIGANFNGVDITNVNLEGAILRPEDLFGAIHNSQTITAENVAAFLEGRVAKGQQVKLQGPDKTICTQVGDKMIQGLSAVDQVKREVAGMRDGGNGAAAVQTTQSNDMSQTDGLINALCQVNAEMAKGGICRTLGGDEHNVGQQHQTAVHQREHDLGMNHGAERV